jgi:hypothetical protein
MVACLALSACGEIGVVPLSDGGEPDGGATGIVTIIVTPSAEDSEPVSQQAPPKEEPPPRRCEHGKTLCNGDCVDLQEQRENCGSCGNACGMNQECNAGVCGCKNDKCVVP